MTFTRASARMNMGRIFTALLFVMYPGLSVASFRVFYCLEANGKKYLYADMRISCDDDRYFLMSTVAFLCICIYVVGIPVMGAVMLYRLRDWIVAEEDMSDEMHEAVLRDLELRERHHHTTLTLGALYLNYTHDAWYYEFVEMIRKALLTGMLASLEKGMVRTSTGTLISIAFMMICSWVRPYRYTSNEILQQVLLLTIFYTFFTALLIDSGYLKPFDPELTSTGRCDDPEVEDPVAACRFDEYDT
jgi:hypothetical protein